jgi:hypothetical protein
MITASHNRLGVPIIKPLQVWPHRRFQSTFQQISQGFSAVRRQSSHQTRL